MDTHVLFVGQDDEFSLILIDRFQDSRDEIVLVDAIKYGKELPMFVDRVPLLLTKDLDLIEDGAIMDFLLQGNNTANDSVLQQRHPQQHTQEDPNHSVSEDGASETINLMNPIDTRRKPMDFSVLLETLKAERQQPL